MKSLLFLLISISYLKQKKKISNISIPAKEQLARQNKQTDPFTFL